MDDAYLPITRCPHCKTAFRVRESQLTQRRGMVRCGGCRSVFNAIQQMLHQRGNTITIVSPTDSSLPPGYDEPPPLNPLTLMPERDPSSPRAERTAPLGTQSPAVDQPKHQGDGGDFQSQSPIDQAADFGLQTNAVSARGETVGEASTLPPSAFTGTSALAAIGATSTPLALPTSTPHPTPVPTPSPTTQYIEPNHEISTDELEAKLAGKPKPMDAVERFEWKQSRPQRPAWIGVAWMLAAIALTLALAAQLLIGYRNDIVMRLPQSREIFTQLCAPLGCTIAPPERPASLMIDGAEFQADTSHTGLYIFTATMRNRHEHGAAYPHLVITLTGLNNAVLSRRIFAPTQYAPGSADLKNGLAGNSEIEFKLFLDASTINPIGFDVRTTYTPGTAT